MTENTAALPLQGAGETIDRTELETLGRYGITRVPAAIYVVGPYRYSNLADAVAEAIRESGRQ